MTLSYKKFIKLFHFFEALKNTGIGERQLNALLAHLNIPPVSVTMLQDRDKEVGNALEEVATESTVKSLDEELHLVKE